MTPERQSPMTTAVLSPLAVPWWNFPERHRRMRQLQARLKALDARISYSIETFQSQGGATYEGELSRDTGSFLAARRNPEGVEEF